MKEPIEKWGKDHFSLLAYVEDVCVHQQSIDRERMRCNPLIHPLLLGYRTGNLPGIIKDGKYAYPTRLKGGAVIEGHDDWNVLDDLEEAGYLEIYSLVNGLVRMTQKGLVVASALRAHKANGGQFAEFHLDPRPPLQKMLEQLNG
jgi:hypothetical protein